MKPNPSFSLPAVFLLGVLFIAGLNGCATTNPTAMPSTETLAALATSSPQTLTFNFDNLPDGLPANWQILYAPFNADSQAPKVVKAQAQENHFVIENLGTFSGLYALYTGEIPTVNLQISLDTLPDGVSPMGVFLVCRYSTAGWYQFRISNGGSSVQYVQPQGDLFNATILAEGPGVFLDDGAHRITGICDQNRLALQADGREILAMEADFLPTGSFGFGVEAFNQPGGRKAFDNVEIKPLSADMASASTPVAALEPATPTPLPVATATPTLLPTPAATLRPTRIPEGELTLYKTEFEDSDPTLADWKTFAFSMDKKDFVTVGYKTWTVNGIYRFEQEVNTRVFAIYDKDLGTADVDISARGGAPFEGHGGLGLVCRYSEAGWYQFMVEPRGGVWTIRLVKPDENGQYHFHIIASGGKWLGQKVDLRAECKGDRLTFYIDGEKMASLHDSTFPTGKVGFLGWSFAIGDDWNTVDKFSARRAQWNETGLPGPAPTLGADGTIYSAEFAKPDDLKAHWAKVDRGVQGVPGSPLLVGGPGQISPHLYQYINDFDPGADLEITADVRGTINLARGIICRYSEDGWYETFYMKDDPSHARVALVLGQRDEQGKLTRYIMDTYYPPKADGSIKLTLTCAGNQISVKVNGEQALYAEDNTWRTGRYGFFFTENPPGDFHSNILLNYSVRPAQAIPAGTVVDEKVFSSPEEIASVFNLDLMNDDRLKIQDNALLLSPGNNPLHPFINSKFADVELTLEAEFPSSAALNLHCRIESASSIGAEINRDGNWKLMLNQEILANGTSPAIQAGKNRLTLSCIGPNITFKVNGQSLASVGELPGYAQVEGAVGWDVYEGSEVKITNVALTVFQSQMPPASPPLNQVAISTYQPGETIFAWDMNNFVLGCGGGWWGRDFNPCFWRKTYNRFVITDHHTDSDILVTPNEKDLTLFTYQPDLYDLPVEISAEATLTSKGGGVALFCRATAVGRYEFYLQPDGKWFIRRNVIPEHYLPKAKHLTILAQGAVENFSPENMQLSATCNGSDLVFVLNGVELGRVQDTLYPEGQAGIFFDVNSEGSFTNLHLNRAKVK